MSDICWPLPLHKHCLVVILNKRIIMPSISLSAQTRNLIKLVAPTNKLDSGCHYWPPDSDSEHLDNFGLFIRSFRYVLRLQQLVELLIDQPISLFLARYTDVGACQYILTRTDRLVSLSCWRLLSNSLISVPSNSSICKNWAHWTSTLYMNLLFGFFKGEFQAQDWLIFLL